MRKNFLTNLLFCVVLGGLVIPFGGHLTHALGRRGLFAAPARPSPEAARLLPRVHLVNYSLEEKPGHLINATFYVRNDSPLGIKNLTVDCEFYDRQRQYVDHKLWLLVGVIPAGKSMMHASHYKRFINSTAQETLCRLVDLEVDRPPFFHLKRHRPHPGDHRVAPSRHE